MTTMENWQWVIGIGVGMLGHLLMVIKFLDGKFGTVWKRFDEHKDQVQTKMQSMERDLSMQYIKKELYDNDLRHLKEMFERVDKSNKEYIGLQFEQIKDLIKTK